MPDSTNPVMESHSDVVAHGRPAALEIPAPRRGIRTASWDLLLVCAAIYLATAVGRVHELFPALMPLKPTFVAAALAVCLYVIQQHGRRDAMLLRSRTTTCLLLLLLWSALSVPAALNQGVAFHFVTDSFVKTVLMCVVLAGSVRSYRDVERLMLVFFAVTVVYAAVVLSRFQLGADDWRLNHLYNYDANDFATLVVTAMPLGLYFVLAQRRLLLRALAIVGLQERGIGVRWGAAHNSFIQVGAELGIPGLLLFVGVIASALASLGRLARNARRTGPAGMGVSRLAQSLMAALVGFVAGAFFLSLAYADMLYMLVALAIALVKIARADDSWKRAFPRPGRL